MKHAIPKFESDEEAEAFVATADLDDYDLSGFKPVRVDVAGRLSIPLPQPLLERTEEYARSHGIPLTKFVQDALERALQGG